MVDRFCGATLFVPNNEEVGKIFLQGTIDQRHKSGAADTFVHCLCAASHFLEVGMSDIGPQDLDRVIRRGDALLRQSTELRTERSIQKLWGAEALELTTAKLKRGTTIVRPIQEDSSFQEVISTSKQFFRHEQAADVANGAILIFKRSQCILCVHHAHMWYLFDSYSENDEKSVYANLKQFATEEELMTGILSKFPLMEQWELSVDTEVYNMFEAHPIVLASSSFNRTSILTGSLHGSSIASPPAIQDVSVISEDSSEGTSPSHGARSRISSIYGSSHHRGRRSQCDDDDDDGVSKPCQPKRRVTQKFDGFGNDEGGTTGTSSGDHPRTSKASSENSEDQRDKIGLKPDRFKPEPSVLTLRIKTDSDEMEVMLDANMTLGSLKELASARLNMVSGTRIFKGKMEILLPDTYPLSGVFRSGDEVCVNEDSKIGATIGTVRILDVQDCTTDLTSSSLGKQS